MINVIEKARYFKYSSLDYVDIEDIKDSKIFISDTASIFLYQSSDIKKELNWESKSNRSFQLFWSANTKKDFLKGLAQTIVHIKKQNQIQIRFILNLFLKNF